MGDLTEAHERRAFPRVRVRIESLVETPHGPLRGQTLDLSAGGAFFTTRRRLPVGTTVQLSMDRGDARNPLALDAEIVRLGSTDEGRFPGIGLRFLGLGPLEVALLRSMIGAA